MKVIETIREAINAIVTTAGIPKTNAPSSPGNSISGRKATMLMIVPKRMARRIRKGPIQAARSGGS